MSFHGLHSPRLFAAAAIVGFIFTATSAPIIASDALVVTRASLWTEGGTLSDHEIVIRDGRVAAVGKSGTLARPVGARILDAEGDALLPGLIDAHVHLVFFDLRDRLPPDIRSDPLHRIYPVVARQMLRSGVTAARVHLINPATGAIFKQQASADTFPAPRLQLGNAIWSVTGVDDAIAKVRDFKARGVDWLAVHSPQRFKRAEVDAMVAEARRVGLRILASGDPIEEAELAVDLGADTVEYLDRTPTPLYPESLLAKMKARGRELFVVPPIGFYHRYIRYLDETMPLDDPRLFEFMPDFVANATRTALREDRNKDHHGLGKTIRAAFPTLPAKFKQLREAGLQLVVGSDNGSWANFHADAIWWELETWRQLGVPPHEVIRAATATAARLLREPELGHLATGARADFLLYRGKIDEGPFSLERVRSVAKGGVLFVHENRWIDPASSP